MSSLYVPKTVARDLAQRTLSFREDVARSIVLDDSDPILREYTAALQRIDPRIIMVRASDQVAPGVPMRPGYYHLLQDSGMSVPLTITVIEGEHGEFAYPTSRVFEKLAAGDMREDRNLERWVRTEQARHDAVEREKLTDRDERGEHRRDLVNAYTRTSVPGTGVGPWRQNQAGHNHGGERELKAAK
jgi:hypothetical protein